MLLIHGYCEHRGRYRETAEHLAQAGYLVMTLDLRGHGQSGGDRAFVQRSAASTSAQKRN
jgi:alpha-beta hydrolase superfamily lysophospholipase